MAEYVASVPYAARLEQLVQITRRRWRRRHDRTNGTLSFPFGVTSAADLMTTRAELYPTTRDRLRRFGLHSLGIHSAYGELTSHNLWSQYDRHFVGKKAKGSRYSITERRLPELIPVLGSQLAGDVSHKPGGRLPLLSARPAVTLATLKGAATNFAAW